MNDFSELENQLRQLCPVAPSENLAARVEHSLAEIGISSASAAPEAGLRGFLRRCRGRFTETPYKLSLGLGLAAAAAAFLVFTRLGVDQPPKKTPVIASRSPGLIAPSTVAPVEFVPASLTRVIYRTRDEGLDFSSRFDQPMRRLRSQARETLQWRNPQTGASLRVSYPSEEVSLIPVSGE